MNTTFELIPIEKNQINTKYKRLLWAGMRNTMPKLGDRLYVGSKNTLEKEITSVGIYPSLISWDTESGERKYAEARKVDKGTV